MLCHFFHFHCVFMWDHANIFSNQVYIETAHLYWWPKYEKHTNTLQIKTFLFFIFFFFKHTKTFLGKYFRANWRYKKSELSEAFEMEYECSWLEYFPSTKTEEDLFRTHILIAFSSTTYHRIVNVFMFSGYHLYCFNWNTVLVSFTIMVICP